MLEIILFAIGVMYTPGPVNILSLNSGAQKQFRAHIPFCGGVASALACWFLLVGYTGSLIVNDRLLPVIAAVGVCFVLYLAYKIMSSRVETGGASQPAAVLTYKDGLLMQLLNPKAMMVVLPVTTVQFPAAGIHGGWIALWSVGLSVLGFGAPLTYAAFGATVFRSLRGNTCLKVMNIIMGMMLIAVAVDMGYSQVYLALAGQ
ncbi:LysE family translocator [Pelobacter seleniigenes]|uniref:LysE family translocator n=1 Tax=Pelobacter seleniigenes TaxID=407188 RepID=UPI0004A6E8A0|nr:LysE family translocator [Pelobacter seleniigenes]